MITVLRVEIAQPFSGLDVVARVPGLQVLALLWPIDAQNVQDKDQDAYTAGLTLSWLPETLSMSVATRRCRASRSGHARRRSLPA